MDWITISVEVMGGIIFCLWIIVPVGEFRKIYQHLKGRPAVDLDQPDQSDSGEHGFPVVIEEKEKRGDEA